MSEHDLIEEFKSVIYLAALVATIDADIFDALVEVTGSEEAVMLAQIFLSEVVDPDVVRKTINIIAGEDLMWE